MSFLKRPAFRMTEQEQRLGRLLALATAVAFSVLWLVFGEGDARLVGAGSGLVLAGALFFAVRGGNRVLAAMVAYFTFLGPWGGFFLLAAPHIAYAIWLALRISRDNRTLRDAERASEQTRTERPERPAPRGLFGRRRTASGDDGAADRRRTSTRDRTPPPSRRYTPPRPKRKRR